MARPHFSLTTRLTAVAVALAALAVAGVLGYAGLFASRTIHELLGENKTLKQSITNLTAEDQIGYAKALAQETRDGKLYTRVLFVETDRHDPARRLLEREYEIEGDVVFFDALIVKFGKQVVMDGKEKSLFLWRRVYGETMSPASGFPIETAGEAPARYADICAKLSIRDRRTFWAEIWKLSDDTERLAKSGVTAIYGSAVYKRIRPGLIYIFRIDANGGFYPETAPDL